MRLKVLPFQIVLDSVRLSRFFLFQRDLSILLKSLLVMSGFERSTRVFEVKSELSVFARISRRSENGRFIMNSPLFHPLYLLGYLSKIDTSGTMAQLVGRSTASQ